MPRNRRAAVLALAIASASIGPHAAERVVTAKTVSGIVRVIDGDGIEIQGQSIRIAGIDAPELHKKRQAGGIVATEIMHALVNNRIVECRRLYWDRRNRWIAVCTVGGVDLGQALVVNGAAWNSPRYKPNYATTQDMAKKNGLGIWRFGAYPAPLPSWQWRSQ